VEEGYYYESPWIITSDAELIIKGDGKGTEMIYITFSSADSFSIEKSHFISCMCKDSSIIYGGGSKINLTVVDCNFTDCSTTDLDTGGLIFHILFLCIIIIIIVVVVVAVISFGGDFLIVDKCLFELSKEKNSCSQIKLENNSSELQLVNVTMQSFFIFSIFILFIIFSYVCVTV
jgi:hypothetical protein